MAHGTDIPAWIALFAGLYGLAAAIGELHRPGFWAAMLDNFVTYPGLRFLAGIVCIATGAAIYLASPWRPGDWLAVLVTVMGGGMALEGAVILAFGEPFTKLARGMLGGFSRAWAVFSAVLGLAFILVALQRL